MSATRHISVLPLWSPLWVFPGVGRIWVPPCLTGYNLATSLCMCVCVFFPTLKTWTMMTQATQSAPQGRYSGNKNNKWIFDCSQMRETARWHWAKSLSRFCPPFIRLGCLVFRKCWKALQIVSARNAVLTARDSCQSQSLKFHSSSQFS